MADNASAQQAATGCLSRILTLIGLFWVGVIVFDLIDTLRFGGNFEITGGFIPALAFLVAGRAMARRAKEAAARSDTFVAPNTPAGTHRATTKEQQGAVGVPTPMPVADRPELEQPKPRPKPANRPVPELPPIEPAPDAGQLQAIEELDITDFQPEEKPMSSEERLRLAREKFLPRRDDDY